MIEIVRCKYPGCTTFLHEGHKGGYCYVHETEGEKLRRQIAEEKAPEGSPNTKLLTITDVRKKWLPYSERSIRQYLTEGKIKGAFKLPGGRKWLIPLEAIEEFLKGKPYRPYLGPLVDGYIVMDGMPFDELYEWLIVHAYKTYPLGDGKMVFVKALR